MELFPESANSDVNILPMDGTVNYYGPILSPMEANHYYEDFLDSIAWQHDQAVIYGKTITTKRKVAWYGDRPFEYTYSNTTKQALSWTEELLKLKSTIEQKSGETYNSCLLNLYHSGEEGMAWHSDGEKDLKKNGAIASVSLGAERRFGFKHKRTQEKVMLLLAHGSLLIMKDETQSHWLHRLPPTKKITTPRVNLTFRTIEE